MPEITHSFRAMNTDVLALVVADSESEAEAEAALRDVEVLFAETEATLSRFRPESELSRLNRSAGEPFPASPLLYSAVEAAMAAARATNGIFDPTVLDALIAAGYDRSFERIKNGGLTPRPPLHFEKMERGSRPDFPLHSPGNGEGRGVRPTWRDVRLDPRTRSITLPVGCGIDLGGIGKGWTVDRAAERLRRLGSFAVDAGGDIYAGGTSADATPWTIGVEDPRSVECDLLVLAVRDRAVATSTVARRRWQKDGRQQHHLIDPRTGRPSESGVIAATVMSGSVAWAEVLAKVALILGPEAGLRFLDAQPGVEGVLVMADGKVVQSKAFHEVLYVA